MKVLKKITSDNWHYKHICTFCFHKLEAEAVDVIYEGYMFCEPELYHCVCPICKISFRIPWDNIPPKVRVQAKSKYSPPSVPDKTNKFKCKLGKIKAKELDWVVYNPKSEYD